MLADYKLYLLCFHKTKPTRKKKLHKNNCVQTILKSTTELWFLNPSVREANALSNNAEGWRFCLSKTHSLGRTSAGVDVNKPSSKTCYCFLIMLYFLFYLFQQDSDDRSEREKHPFLEQKMCARIELMGIASLPIFLIQGQVRLRLLCPTRLHPKMSRVLRCKARANAFLFYFLLFSSFTLNVNLRTNSAPEIHLISMTLKRNGNAARNNRE